MGAVAGKVVQDLTGTTRAEDRLAAAERVIIEFERRRSSEHGTSVSIWDANAACTNTSLLAAVDDIVFLKETHAFPMASAAGRRMDGVLRAAMSHLLDELLCLRVWDGSQLEGKSGLRFAVEKLSVSMAEARGVSSPALIFLTGGSTASTVKNSTGEVSFGAVDELYVSGGSQPAGADVFLDGNELHLICPGSLSVLHEISLRVIRAGYTEELLHTFAKAPCDVLDRFLSILQVGCSMETDEVTSYENAEWWTAEDMIRKWILATKLVEKALATMQMQLRAQSNGAFDRFKDEYLMAIAKRSTSTLLRFADGFTGTHSTEKLIYVLEMYGVLHSAVPGLMLVFTGQHKELFSRQVEAVLTKLAHTLRIIIGGLVMTIWAGASSGSSQSSIGAGVHPLTRYTIACINLLTPHRAALDLVLASTAGGTECLNSFDGLVSELITSLEQNLEETSTAFYGAQGEGLWHLFLANNTNFRLKHAASLPRGDECQDRVVQHMADYVESSWGPVVACLEATGAGKPAAKILAKFNFTLERVYSSHACCKVPDPMLREALRKAVSDKVVAGYAAYLLKHPKLEKSARYTAEGLAGLLSELFEGEDGEGRYS